MPLADDIGRLRPALMAYAMRRVKNADIADDLTQDTLLRMLKRQHLFEPGTNLKAWGFTILTRINIDRIRKDSKGPNVQQTSARRVEGEFHEGSGHDLEDDIPQPVPARQEDSVFFKEVLAFIRTLPRQHALAILQACRGDDHTDIAGDLEVPVGTLRKYLLSGRNTVYLEAFDATRPRINEPRKVKVSA